MPADSYHIGLLKRKFMKRCSNVWAGLCLAAGLSVLFPHPAAGQAEVSVSFETGGFASVGVYDRWEESPFRGGPQRLEGNVAVVRNHLQETDGATGDVSRHTGVDLSVSINTPVTAPAAGRVVYAGWLDRTGGTVVIEHGAGIKSYLFHLAEVTCSVNDLVDAGTQVGVSGIAGYTDKPHVHFEVRVGNQSVDPAKLVNGSSAAVQ